MTARKPTLTIDASKDGDLPMCSHGVRSGRAMIEGKICKVTIRNKVEWTAEEDNEIVEQVRMHGEGNWPFIFANSLWQSIDTAVASLFYCSSSLMFLSESGTFKGQHCDRTFCDTIL